MLQIYKKVVNVSQNEIFFSKNYVICEKCNTFGDNQPIY